jgi:hypothetical protein
VAKRPADAAQAQGIGRGGATWDDGLAPLAGQRLVQRGTIAEVPDECSPVDRLGYS